MLPTATDYQALRDSFQWTIPAHYNIGVDICDRWADLDPDRLALIHLDEKEQEQRVTFGQLQKRSNQLANTLKAHGISRGDRVALILPQSPEVAIAHIALYKLGAIVVPLALLFGTDALRHRLSDSGAKAIITNETGQEKLATLKDELSDLALILSVDTPTGDARPFHDLCAQASDHFTALKTRPDDPALMIYTSGTTGLAKGALHGHRVLLGHLPGFQMAHAPFPDRDDRFWTPADWAWAGGLLNALLPSLHFGIPVVSYRSEKFDPELAFDRLARYRIQNTFLPPTALKLLRTVPDPQIRYDLHIRTIMSAGEALGREVYNWARETLNITINEAYGQTECNLVIGSMNSLGISRSGAIGKAVPGHTVAIIDEDGHVCPTDVLGQIAVKSPDPVMFLEYWNQPQATKSKFIGDWMITGDQGIRDKEGYIHFIGRNDDVITSSGYRIGPAEIEDCLISHPAVELAAVIGKEDPDRTEIIKAYIVLRKGHNGNDDLVSEIQNYVKTRLAAYQYPREITFLDHMPMTTTGKIIRRLLRDRD